MSVGTNSTADLSAAIAGDRKAPMTKEKNLSKSEVRRRLVGLSSDQKKSVLCSLVGHSRIQTYCFGYYSCARCEQQLGDTLGGSYGGAETAVIVGHDCKICRKNAKTLTWKDTMLAPEPFIKKRQRQSQITSRKSRKVVVPNLGPHEF